MYAKGCNEHPLFIRIVEQKNKLKPNADTSFYLGLLKEKSGLTDEALAFYNQAVNLETDKFAKAKILFKIATNFKNKGRFGQARKYYHKTLIFNPSMGRSYLAVAAMYSKSANNCGMDNFSKRDVFIKVFPFDTELDEMLKFKPHGFFLSNGPGDPKPLTKVINTAKQILDKDYPLFGICLGHQIIALANGIKTYKMFNGHRGINHPVLNLNTGKGEITSQNHGFAVDYDTANSSKSVKISHKHLNDQTVAGLEVEGKKCFSVQYHPEAGPGPNDGNYLFDQFLSKLK